MSMVYSSPVLTRFCAPEHVGTLAGADVFAGRAQAAGGDLVLEMTMRVCGDSIQAAAFRVHGCPASVAVADWVCAWLAGKTTEQARALTTREIETALELAPEKRVCCLMALDALGVALSGNVTVDRADSAVRAESKEQVRL